MPLSCGPPLSPSEYKINEATVWCPLLIREQWCKSVLIRPSLFQRFPDRGRGEREGHRGRGWAHNCHRSQGVLARRQPELRSVKNGLVHRLGRRIKTHFNRGKGQSIENIARERCNICCTKSTIYSNNYILVNFSPKNSVIVIRRFFHYSVNE